MPLPWKKSKFSRIVADHLHSAKQGGSLVVETGFPTSLVDLFVKNRDGLKRSSKKKKDHRRSDVEQIVCGPINGESFSPVCHGYTSPARSLSSPESFYNVFTPSPTISPSSSFSSSPVIWRTPPHSSFSGSPIRGIELFSVGDENEVADGKGVIFAILKVFFVVALALGTKQFVVGLIISAFLLIFMEFIGKPCQQAQISLRNFFEQIKRITRIKNVQTGSENQIEEPSSKETRISKPSNHLKPPRGKDTTRTISSSRSFHLKPESDDQEFPIGGNLIHCKSLNWLSEEMDNREDATQIKDSHKKNQHRNGKIKSKIIRLLSLKKKEEIEDPITKSRSSRLKSKIKKIVVPTSKKKQQQQQQQTNPDFLRIEEPIVCYSEEQSCTSPSRSDDVREDTASVSTERPPEERRVDCVGKRSFCFVLLPIILVGLMCGRFWAIAFTLVWCLIWKFTCGMLWKA
ncbi:uncharacterized protein LOC124932072 [Impatiens glandulifera]|uniref:uncharacterized protein LOC124932072 n=1 Tax=Impatiens glandulifera TaxID=253017 RepID=UPI001FB0A128|nr:uncharacterized protein LOC124932072 [Impatiens glandulifera]